MIRLEGGVEAQGLLFRNDVSKSIRHQMGGAVSDLSLEGRQLVSAFLEAGIEHWTGQTASGVEAVSYARGMYASGSLWGKVRMAPGLSREGSSTRPYIINHVLEAGGYGGGRAMNSRGRMKWKRGTRHQRKALHQWRNTTRELKARAGAIRVDLTRQLEDG